MGKLRRSMEGIKVKLCTIFKAILMVQGSAKTILNFSGPPRIRTYKVKNGSKSIKS